MGTNCPDYVGREHQTARDVISPFFIRKKSNFDKRNGPDCQSRARCRSVQFAAVSVQRAVSVSPCWRVCGTVRCRVFVALRCACLRTVLPYPHARCYACAACSRGYGILLCLAPCCGVRASGCRVGAAFCRVCRMLGYPRMCYLCRISRVYGILLCLAWCCRRLQCVAVALRSIVSCRRGVLQSVHGVCAVLPSRAACRPGWLPVRGFAASTCCAGRYLIPSFLAIGFGRAFLLTMIDVVL